MSALRNFSVALLSLHILLSAVRAQEVNVTFTNETQTPVDLFWVGPNGNEAPFGQIAPGASQKQPSYANHTWKIAAGTTSSVEYTVSATAEQLVPIRNPAGRGQVARALRYVPGSETKPVVLPAATSSSTPGGVVPGTQTTPGSAGQPGMGTTPGTQGTTGTGSGTQGGSSSPGRRTIFVEGVGEVEIPQGPTQSNNMPAGNPATTTGNTNTTQTPGSNPAQGTGGNTNTPSRRTIFVEGVGEVEIPQGPTQSPTTSSGNSTTSGSSKNPTPGRGRQPGLSRDTTPNSGSPSSTTPPAAGGNGETPAIRTIFIEGVGEVEVPQGPGN